MGRHKGDEKYWNEVTSFEENGKKRWTCKHCKKTYGGGYSRIKLHLDKEQKGQGITKCPVYCSNEEVHNIIASTSIHPQETTLNPLQVVEDAVAHGMIDTVASIFHQTNIESSCLFGGWPENGMDESNNLNDAFQREISVLKDLVSDLTREEDDIKRQLQYLESYGKKRKCQVDDWMNELRDLKKRVADLDQSRSTDFFACLDDEEIRSPGLKEIDQLTVTLRHHKDQKPPVLSNEFVGEEFGKNVKKMWKLLGDDQVFVIGIHGMGGVGKTFLATYIENEIKRNGTFRHVFWVTVTPDFTIFKLQHQIAKKIGIKLDEDDERSQATILSLELEKIEKSVLILDDVWKYIDLQKVGIPLKVNGIKLIITSRLKHVSRQMDCLQCNTIEVKHLDDDEGWELFLLKLGHSGTPAALPSQVLEIARSVVRRCGGLPLAINVMARTMKGCYDNLIMWRHELNKLQNFEMGEEMKEEVFPVLKRSYDNLVQKDMQMYLLYFALLPTNLYTKTSVLGGYFFHKQHIEGCLFSAKRSLREVFEEGRVIVDKLIDHSLFKDYVDSIQMHDLVRSMTCHILKENHNYMVKCNKELSKIPDVNEWTIDLEVVSLGGNKIKEISGISPNCPRLSTLILTWNFISHISEDFFVLMNALTVLDLSYNRELTCLPDSLFNLRSLVSLMLRYCSKLERIPPIGGLQALLKLDIAGCAIRDVPNGFENLINLKLFDLSMNSHLKLAPGRVLPNLTNMQWLEFIGSDVILKICFTEFEFSPYLSPGEQQKMFVLDSNQWVCLCDTLSSSGPSFNDIGTRDFTKLKSLFCLSSYCSLCTNFQNLELLAIHGLKSLTAICKEDVVDLTRYLSPTGLFSNLKYFYFWECHEIETLFTPGLVPQLRNLECISIAKCNSIKEIFAVSGDNFNIILPKLTILKLMQLPHLKTVCRGILVCGSEDILFYHNCPNLERLPVIRRV